MTRAVNPHFPAEIARQEAAHILSRRRKFGVADAAPSLGVALSGGGIRSATASLGIFQYFAREERRARQAVAAATRGGSPPQPASAPGLRMLSRIDYCSSVSGGGYFATFFGSLFLPKDERAKGAQLTPEALRAEAPEEAAEAQPPPTKWEQAAERVADVLTDTTFDGSRMTPMRWLRENGRYLAPSGGGDYLYAFAVAVRNFLGLHYVIGVSLLAVFFAAVVVRVLGFAYAPDVWLGKVEAPFLPDPGANLWPSIWWVPALAAFALIVVPIGVAFFLAQIERIGARFPLNLPLITALGVALLCFAYAIAGEAPRLEWPPATLWAALADLSPRAIIGWRAARLTVAYIGVAALLAAVCYAVARIKAWLQVHGPGMPAPGTPGRKVEPAATTLTRTRLSHALIVPLVFTLALAAFALVDTIGQTVYALWTVESHYKWLAGGGTIALLIPLLKKLLPLVTGSGDPSMKAWVRVPMSALALVAGVALFVAVASVWSALMHGIVWAGRPPAGNPGCLMMLPEREGLRDVSLDAERRIVVAAAPAARPCAADTRPLDLPAWAWIFGPLLVVAIFTGHGVGFINLSSLQRYYAGHLMRSYLRASRFAEDPQAERDVRSAEPFDDITVDVYYHPSSLAPLHFVNVTLNQTVASGSQLVQRDRKGMNLAIGPYGFTLGNRSFVGWDRDRMSYDMQRCPAEVIGVPDDSALPRYQQGTKLFVEPLSIGNWCAISGAAFTTGHGKGTTLGLSLLLALTNVRLGYWWNAEVKPPEPTRESPHDPRWVESLSAVFRTQSYLLNEMFARYYGTRRSHWYLSDGGHFENTAAYELLRRRVPRIIVLDNGRDAKYAFDDVANLVRKARIDLDTEIEFLTAEELWEVVDVSVRRYFATPEEFRSQPRGRAYATLARIRYREVTEPGLMLVVKPRVTGLEPLDIQNYQQASPEFPQQSTTDQFYDEAQWESYRSLGFRIAEQLFAGRAAVPGKWIPRHMFE